MSNEQRANNTDNFFGFTPIYMYRIIDVQADMKIVNLGWDWFDY